MNEDKRTDMQITDSIISQYLEQNQKKEYYAFHILSGSYGEDIERKLLYYAPSEEEKEFLRQYNDEVTEDTDLFEYFMQSDIGNDLLFKFARLSNSYNPVNIESFNIDRTYHSIDVTLRILGEDDKHLTTEHRKVHLTDKEFRQLLQLFITKRNRVSCNIMATLMPEMTAKILRELLDSFNNSFYEFAAPFVFEMTEIIDIVDSIMDPLRDSLHILGKLSNDNRLFWDRYSIFPNHIYLYHVGSKIITADFIGDRFEITDMDLSIPNDSSRKDYQQAFKTKVIGDYLKLEKHEDFLTFLHDHFNTETALHDIVEYVQTNCPEAMISRR